MAWPIAPIGAVSTRGIELSRPGARRGGVWTPTSIKHAALSDIAGALAGVSGRDRSRRRRIPGLCARRIRGALALRNLGARVSGYRLRGEAGSGGNTGSGGPRAPGGADGGTSSSPSGGHGGSVSSGGTSASGGSMTMTGGVGGSSSATAAGGTGGTASTSTSTASGTTGDSSGCSCALGVASRGGGPFAGLLLDAFGLLLVGRRHRRRAPDAPPHGGVDFAAISPVTRPTRPKMRPGERSRCPVPQVARDSVLVPDGLFWSIYCSRFVG